MAATPRLSRQRGESEHPCRLKAAHRTHKIGAYQNPMTAAGVKAPKPAQSQHLSCATAAEHPATTGQSWDYALPSKSAVADLDTQDAKVAQAQSRWALLKDEVRLFRLLFSRA